MCGVTRTAVFLNSKLDSFKNVCNTLKLLTLSTTTTIVSSSSNAVVVEVIVVVGRSSIVFLLL
jgi:hypothetical protein